MLSLRCAGTSRKREKEDKMLSLSPVARRGFHVASCVEWPEHQHAKAPRELMRNGSP